MKYLRSSIEDLRRIFEQSISVRDIAEPCASFDAHQSCAQVHGFMEEKGYDVVGVRSRGMIEGYVLLQEISSGTLEGVMHPIKSEFVIPDSSALLSAFELLRERRWIFVTILDRVWGIVSRGDLQKAPVRMWLFGLISLAEMHLLLLVRELCPEEEWRKANLLTRQRQANAEKVFQNRRKRSQETDLTDCLQLCDKVTILRKKGKIFEKLGFESNLKAQAFFSDFEDLRNALAHAQDIVTDRWPGLIDLTIGIERFLLACEARRRELPT